jgi:hypothetical protein
MFFRGLAWANSQPSGGGGYASSQLTHDTLQQMAYKPTIQPHPIVQKAVGQTACASSAALKNLKHGRWKFLYPANLAVLMLKPENVTKQNHAVLR